MGLPHHPLDRDKALKDGGGMSSYASGIGLLPQLPNFMILWIIEYKLVQSLRDLGGVGNRLGFQSSGYNRGSL